MRSSMAMAGVVLGLSMGGLSDAAAAMMVSGVISADTVWSAAQSPVTVQGDVTVDQDATLTVEPGVEVRMAANASFTLNRGAVVAVGTVGKTHRDLICHCSACTGLMGAMAFQARHTECADAPGACAHRVRQRCCDREVFADA